MKERLSNGWPKASPSPTPKTNHRNFPDRNEPSDNDGVKPRAKAHRLKRYDPLVEARVMNQLQKRKNGLTLELLQNTLKTSQAEILAVLELYRNEGHVTRSKRGVWTLVREEAETPKPS